jgi:16S rRNA C967 or C1407 C5-methylase (RsmB/RsmF family)
VRAQLWLDTTATYSVTEEKCADAMTHLLSLFFKPAFKIGHQPTVLDATACVGGNTFSLQKLFKTIACEMDSVRFTMLKTNMRVLGANAHLK